MELSKRKIVKKNENASQDLVNISCKYQFFLGKESHLENYDKMLIITKEGLGMTGTGV